MSIISIIQSKEFIASITTIASTIVGATIALFANTQNQRAIAKRKYGEELLIEVYVPLMITIEERAIIDAEYAGLEIEDINYMLNVIRKKFHLVDQKLYNILYNYQWENRESWDDISVSVNEYKNQTYDTLNHEFLNRLQYVIEKTKKEIGVSYDKSILKKYKVGK